MNKVNKGSKRGTTTKILLWSTIIEFLTLNLKEGMEMVLLFKGLFMVNVGSIICVSSLAEPKDALGVEEGS